MRRFIRYLYEYEQGQRARNVGFVKVEQDDAESIIHIHGKGLRLAGTENLQVHLLCEGSGEISGIHQGEIAYMGPALNYRLRYTREDTGVPENYDKMLGILLEGKSGRKFAAVWDDRLIDMENIRPWRVPKHTAEPQPAREPEHIEGPRQKREEPKEEPEIESEELEIRREIETEEEPKIRPEPEAGETEPVCPWQVTKIQRREISMLSRCEWRLANNNFLLHGYYNYRHLVLLDDGKMLKLGVPGVYHEKEAKVAGSLGFPEFISADRTKLSLSPQECSDEPQFGYWCRQVRRPGH